MKSVKDLHLSKGRITELALLELSLRNCEVWRENNLAVRGRKFIGRKGKPDIIGHHNATGIAVYCEVKTINDTFSPEQREFLRKAKKSGCICLTATELNNRFELVEWK